jgi:hypothetical protein
MSSQGELSYHHFIIKLVEKAKSRYISVKDVQKIGTFFWGVLSEEFKHSRKEEEGRNAFWNFAIAIKNSLTNNEFDELNSLWEDFDVNGKNLFENLYNNCILHNVNRVF